LIRDLDATELRGADDPAIVLRAYDRWRDACAGHLLGDFAFTIYDPRARRVYCARDVMGIRPFCYAAVGWTFLFGSELRQVLASGRVNNDPDEAAVAEYLSNAITSRDATLYRYVRRLPPAHWMAVDADRFTVSRYWHLDPTHTLQYRDDREYVEHFRSLFEQAVTCRMRSARPRIAAWLSGGVDSSSVVAMAGGLQAADGVPSVETFSMVFPDDPAADERSYIADVVARVGLPSHTRSGARPDGARFRDQAAAYRDVPDLPVEHLIADVRDAVRGRGINVVLTGAGGDHGFSGSLYHYADLLRGVSVVTLLRQIVADARVSDVGWAPSRLFTMGVLPLLPRRFKDAVRPVARRFGWPGGAPRWIPAAFAARVGLDARLRSEAPETRTAADMWVHAAFESGWSVLMLEMAERSAAAHGLEERHPFFDRRIMEFALAIPEAQRWRGTQTKIVMREALRDRLPVSVYNRRNKADFSPQVIRAIGTLGGAAFFDRLEIAALGWIDQARVSGMYRDMMRRFRAGGDAYTKHMFPLWMVASVELWKRSEDARRHEAGSSRVGAELERRADGRAPAVSAAGAG